MCHSITVPHIVCSRLSFQMAVRVFTMCDCRRILCQRSITTGRSGRSRTLSMNRGQPDRNGLVTVRTSKFATTSRPPTISPSRTGVCGAEGAFVRQLPDYGASQESRRSEADSGPRTMSNVQHKQRKNQAAAAALARSLAFHSARKSFISALTLAIRDPTPLYFLMTPVTVLVTAPWLTRLCSFS
jgi:hypothetical protein